MTNILLVGLGGSLGAIARYALGGWVHKVLDSPWFPYGTLVVNVVGCFLIGFLAGLAETRQVFGAEVRLFLFIGLLGGFTTFSTFGYETFSLARDGQFVAAGLNACLQVVSGLAAVWLGHAITRFL